MVENLLVGTISFQDPQDRPALPTRQRLALSPPLYSARWISGPSEANAPPMPLWPSPRPSQALILGTSPPTSLKTIRPSCRTIPRAPGASRPPIRSIGRRTRGKVERKQCYHEQAREDSTPATGISLASPANRARISTLQPIMAGPTMTCFKYQKKVITQALATAASKTKAST